MTRRVAAIVVGCVVAGAVALGVASPTPTEASPVAVTAASIVVSDPVCTEKCRPCYFSTEMYAVGPGGTHTEPYDCAWLAFIGCPVPNCGAQDDDAAALSVANTDDVWKAVISGDVGAIRDVMAYPNVFLNVDRAAIQVTGCNGAVTAHIPLAPSQLEQLSENF